MPSDDSGLSGLQFDRAEPVSSASTADCVACASPLAGRYYTINGHSVCPSCTEAHRMAVQEPSSQDYLRALLYGAGAALAGTAVYFAILAISGYEIGWIAVAVGWLVGKAVHKGSRGIGGRKLQVIAVVLTYLSIVGSYVPLILKGAMENARSLELLSLVFIFGYSLVLPFLQGFGSILSLFIICIGLYEAWKQNRRVPMTFEGPFEIARPESAA
jgi:hypothetical protein